METQILQWRKQLTKLLKDGETSQVRLAKTRHAIALMPCAVDFGYFNTFGVRESYHSTFSGIPHPS